MKTFILIANFIFISSISFANVNEENYDYLYSYYPNGLIRSKAMVKQGELQGFTELLPFVSRAPNQSGAGSCHFMALTGNAEFWLAKLNPDLSWEPNGPLDLSERYLMNINGNPEYKTGLENWKTDSIYLFNNAGKAVLNKSYPFTKGWWKKKNESESTSESANHLPALPNEEGAAYGTHYNWIDETTKITDGLVLMPKFSREVLFADPNGNQWGVMVAPEDIVEKVKNALIKNHAPVTVMYNNIGIWHVVMIVGFDDELSNDNCYFTRNFPNSLDTLISIRQEEYEKENAVDSKNKILGKIKKLQNTKETFVKAYELRGSCSGKGGFYVRDSVYSDPEGPVYDYFTGRPEDKQNYSTKIIIREYEWLKYFANHIWQITSEI